MKQGLKLTFLQVLFLLIGFFGFIVIIYWLRNIIGNEIAIIIMIIITIITLFVAGKIIRIKKEKRLEDLAKKSGK